MYKADERSLTWCNYEIVFSSAGWAVTTSDDVREKRMERAAKSVDATPKLKEIPDVQIPMYAGASFGGR